MLEEASVTKKHKALHETGPSPREGQNMRASFDQRRVHDFSHLQLKNFLKHSKQVLQSSFIKGTNDRRKANSLVNRALQRLFRFI